MHQPTDQDRIRRLERDIEIILGTLSRLVGDICELKAAARKDEIATAQVEAALVRSAQGRLDS
jgi:hypothetical protein